MVNKSIQFSIKEKNRLYQISCKHSHLDIYYKKYKQYNNILTHVKQQLKQNYFQHHLEINKINIKKTWKTINSIIRKPTKHINFTKIRCPVTDIDLRVFSTKDISSCLNHYFLI